MDDGTLGRILKLAAFVLVVAAILGLLTKWFTDWSVFVGWYQEAENALGQSSASSSASSASSSGAASL